jgi:hypothetical protein
MPAFTPPDAKKPAIAVVSVLFPHPPFLPTTETTRIAILRVHGSLKSWVHERSLARFGGGVSSKREKWWKIIYPIFESVQVTM